MASYPPHLQALLDHRGWVQDLAHRLLHDAAAAEDVAQEALLVALRAPDARPRSVRAWLGAVVRNLVWERMRREDRRATRELRVARAEETPSTVELVEEVSAHREIVDALMGLPEHYRDVLVRRYYEGETPTEIAAAQGTPVATVKTRLQRGLALLRERLDARFGGDGRAWLSALAPLARAGGRAARGAPAAAGALRIALLALPALLAPAVLFWVLAGGAGDPPASRVDAPGELRSAGSTVELAAADRAADATRRDATEAPDLSFEARRAALAAALEHSQTDLRGSVLDLAGRPVGGALVRFDRDALSSASGGGVVVQVSGDDGRFELRGVRGSGLVRAVAEGLVTVSAASVGGFGASDEVAVVMAPERSLAGLVVGEEGAPLAGARLELMRSADLLEHVGTRAARAVPLAFRAETDLAGRFDLGVPRQAGVRLRVTRLGYEPCTLDLGGSGDELRVVLRRTSFEPPLVRGLVVDAAGEPVPDARVAGGGRVTVAGPDGRFALAAGGVSELWAFAAGSGAAHAASGAGWPDPLVLALEPAPRRIAGRVVDAAGRPLAGVEVWIDDPTVLRPGHMWGAAGEQVETVGRRREEAAIGELPLLLESALAGERERIRRAVATGPDGRFELGGLAARAYRVAAVDLYTLALVRSGSIEAGGEAGGEVELVLSAALREPLSGRVVDRSGRPVAGVSVLRQRSVLTLALDGEKVWGEGVLSPGFVTRGDGLFQLEGLAEGPISLRLEGEDIVPRAYGTGVGEGLAGDVRIVVERRFHARFHRTGDEPGEARVLDAAGRPGELLRLEGGRRVRTSAIPFREGRSGVLVVPEAAERVELLLEGGEELVFPLRLQPGVVNDVRL
ncbi:MAG: sigma-70 family RNA polymerase sigma factor [Planctomycetota bacterium]